MTKHTYSGSCFCNDCCQHEVSLKAAMRADKMTDAHELVGKRKEPISMVVIAPLGFAVKVA